MLEKLLTTQAMVKYLQSQFEDEIISLSDSIYNPKTDFRISNPYSEKKIIISCQARKGQNKETINDFSKKLIQSKTAGDILIPIFLTGKAGKNYTNDFVFPYKQNKGAVRNANPHANIHNLYGVNPKVILTTKQQQGNLFVLVQREKFDFDIPSGSRDSEFYLKHFETKPITYLPRKTPNNFNQLPGSEQLELQNDPLYQIRESKSGLHFIKDPRSFSDIRYGILEYFVKPNL